MATQPRSKALHISLWVAQVLLAGMFLMAGANKLFQPMAGLAEMLPWVVKMPAGLVRFIGGSELTGALGLLLPSLLRVKPALSSLAAMGLAVVMVLASIFHVSQGEASVIGMNIILMGVALFIAWGRFKKAPIHAKTKN